MVKFKLFPGSAPVARLPILPVLDASRAAVDTCHYDRAVQRDRKRPAVRFDHACFGCGDENPIGLHLQISPTAQGVSASFVPEPAHQGFDNVIHGGIISAVHDEAMAWATTRAGIWAVTAEMAVRFKNPLAVGEPATVTARVTENRGRIATTAAELTRDRDGAAIAIATATFVRVSDTLAAEWQRRYLENADASDNADDNSGLRIERVTAAGEQLR